MRTIIWFAYFWISLIVLFPAMLYAYYLDRTKRVDKRDALVRHTVSAWMSSLLKLAGVRLHIEGLEHIPDEPCVFVSNHQGNFDIPILLCGLDYPHGVVAKKQVARMPFIRVWMRYFGCVFLDRDNPRQSVEALGQAAQNIRDGYPMIIFPEGTRSRGKEIKAFKPGAFRVASKTGAPIIPVCIEGSYRAMEAQGFWIRPAEVRVSLLPPVETAGLSKEQLQHLPDQLHEIICNEREQLLAQVTGS